MEINSLLSLPNHLCGTTEAGVVERVTHAFMEDSPVYGQFAFLHTDAQHVWLIRDRLGLNKLFYVLDRERRLLTVGNSLFDVASATRDFNRVVSVPPDIF